MVLYPFVKRLADIVLSFLLIVLLSPLLGVLALWVRLDSPGPVLFRQRRFGRDRSFFDILKFRTMRVEAPGDVPTHLLEDPGLFITSSGRFLRRSSLDELPQLFNILVGDMSFVGPRPGLWNQVDLMDERDRYGANGVPVGLTGWAQINGRDELSIEDKAKLDGVYVREFGLWMDIRCFVGTFIRVLGSHGFKEGNARH